MTKENLMRLHRIYKILLSTSIILAGICLIIGCVSIYYSGNGYSRQIVLDTFSKINIPIFLSLALIIGDVIWEFFSPTETKKHKVFNKNSNNTLQLNTINKKIKITRLVILGVAVATLILGFLADGYVDVLTKAVNICTECIGLG